MAADLVGEQNTAALSNGGIPSVEDDWEPKEQLGAGQPVHVGPRLVCIDWDLCVFVSRTGRFRKPRVTGDPVLKATVTATQIDQGKPRSKQWDIPHLILSTTCS